MRVGLIDVDGHNYPNLAQMKLSAWHKRQGDQVEWYDPWKGLADPYDLVFMSKVFSFSPDYEHPVYAKEVVKGGTGYCISLQDGKEVYDKHKDSLLPDEVEHIMPDYSIYGITDTAYGFLTRGCPRQCSFCHVAAKEGCKSHKTADLSEFWDGQKNIEILDPNLLACPSAMELLFQLRDSKAVVNFNQGLDIRMMTEEKAKMLNNVRTKYLHFAWDRIEDRDMIVPKFKEFREISRKYSHDLVVYVLCGDRERRLLPSDIERVEWLKDNGFDPYVMLYDKEHLEAGHDLRRFQRYVNNKAIFWKCKSFMDYERR